MDYKNIHIGSHIKKIAQIKELSITRACIFLKCSHQDILIMYEQETLEAKTLLRWSKLLEYNFFMIYHTHLQMFSPISASTKLIAAKEKEREQYEFRKNIYSEEIILWLLKKMENGELTPQEIINKYHIPRTTIYRWKKRHTKI